MHLPHAPGHVRGRKGHVQSLSDADLVHFIDVIDPKRHPRALVSGFVIIDLERRLVAALPTATLRTLTKENLDFARADCSKRGRRSPVPKFFPAPLREPGETPADVGYVQDWRHAFGVHGAQHNIIRGTGMEGVVRNSIPPGEWGFNSQKEKTLFSPAVSRPLAAAPGRIPTCTQSPAPAATSPGSTTPD